MHNRLLIAALPVLFAATSGLQHAHADIYTWVDSSGRVNISNLDPPDGARVTRVQHTDDAKAAVARDAARDALQRAEVQALADRVRQLQDEVEAARRQPPAPVEYRVATPSFPPPYASEGAVMSQPDYSYAYAPVASVGCDPSWWSCSPWWGPGFYSSTAILVSRPSFQRGHRFHDGRNPGGRPPISRPVGPRRR